MLLIIRSNNAIIIIIMIITIKNDRVQRTRCNSELQTDSLSTLANKSLNGKTDRIARILIFKIIFLLSIPLMCRITATPGCENQR